MTSRVHLGGTNEGEDMPYTQKEPPYIWAISMSHWLELSVQAWQPVQDGYWNDTKAARELPSSPCREGKVNFPSLPSPSAGRPLQKGCRRLFKKPFPLFLLVLQLCACWLLGCSQMAVIIKKRGIWPADYTGENQAPAESFSRKTSSLRSI